MGTEITAPNPQISEQGNALALLLSLTQKFGHLPAAYLKIHRPFLTIPAQLGLQVDSPEKFEQWRAALEIAPSDVELHATTDEHVWLSAKRTIRGVPVEVTGFGVPLTAEQATTPQAEASAVAA
ncbi:hypothetical protein ACWDA7_19530 [Streptomyces sp. NPDC001156]